MELSIWSLKSVVANSDYGKVWDWNWFSDRNFYKLFFSGAFIAIVMTGLDQDMMQKNLTCKSIGEAQKNMFWFSIILVFANLLFLTLGVLLFMYAANNGIAIPSRTDDLFPLLALNHLGTFAGITFLLGITAAAYSSADSALTALTTSFCVDFLDFDTEKDDRKTRTKVHLMFSVLLFVVILIFRVVNDQSVIAAVFTAAGYTYGPLLGMYAFGLFTKKQVKDKWVPLVAIMSPILSYLVSVFSVEFLNGYQFGFELLILNGLITFLGLLVIQLPAKGLAR